MLNCVNASKRIDQNLSFPEALLTQVVLKDLLLTFEGLNGIL